jgi:hypothetical protein
VNPEPGVPLDLDDAAGAEEAAEPEEAANSPGDPVPLVLAHGERAAKYSRDFVKPQYIDFRNPLLVKLFAKLPGPFRQFNVVFEECLPGVEDLPCVDGQAYASELVLQVNFPQCASVAEVAAVPRALAESVSYAG